MTGAAPALLHHHGVSSRATLPVYHGNSRLVPGSCFLSKSTILGPLTVSLVCGATPNNHRPRNPDISQQQKRGSSSRGKSKPFQERDDSENNDEFDSDTVSSKNGPPISLTSNSRPHATSAPGEREKEIVELFKRVQAQLRARGKGREDKKPEPAKSQGERGSVDSLLNLLRRHSVDQKRKSSDEKEQNFDQTWRSSDSGNKQSSRIFGMKNDAQEGQKPPPATFQRPPSSFRRRSPVPGVKFQLVTNPDADAGAKPVVNGITDAVLKAKTPLEEETARDEPDSVSLYEPDSVIAPEDASLDDFVVSDDEPDLLDADEPDEYLEPLDNADDVTDSTASNDDSLADPYSIVASYFSENSASVVRCCELPQVSLREKASKVLSLLVGEQPTGSKHLSESRTTPTHVQMPDLIDTGDQDDLVTQTSAQESSEQIMGNSNYVSSVDDLLGGETIGNTSATSNGNGSDLFADVSFHEEEIKETNDLFSGLTVEEKSSASVHDNSLIEQDIFGSSPEPLFQERVDDKGTVDDLMAGLNLNGTAQAQTGVKAETNSNLNGSQFFDMNSQTSHVASGAALNGILGQSSLYQQVPLQYNLSPQMFGQSYPGQQLNYGAMEALLAQQQQLLQNLGNFSAGLGHPAFNSMSGGNASGMPDIFNSSNQPPHQVAVMSNSKKDETKAFDFVSDHLAAARGSKK